MYEVEWRLCVAVLRSAWAGRGCEGRWGGVWAGCVGGCGGVCGGVCGGGSLGCVVVGMSAWRSVPGVVGVVGQLLV